MRDYRLPDPPPDLRDRIISKIEGSHERMSGNDSKPMVGTALLVGALLFMATLLVVVNLGSREGEEDKGPRESTVLPSDPNLAASDSEQDPKEEKAFDPFEPPDSIHCKAVLSQKDPDQCTLRFTEFRGTRRQERAFIKVRTGKWAQLKYGDTVSGTMITGIDEGMEPKVEEVEILESGIHIVAKTRPSPIKGVIVTARVYFFKDRKAVRTYSYEGDSYVGPGETTVYRLTERDRDGRLQNEREK